MEKHEYQAPGPDDLRSPCPALNTLANHGYLPRDGKDITPAQFADAIYEAYNVSKVASYTIAQAGLLLVGKTFEGKMSLDDLFGERIEHPMSLTRPDIGLSEDYKKVSPKLIDSLFSEKNENNKLTRESYARQFIKRRDQSLKDNPKFTGLTYGKRFQIFGEYALSLICFPENENGRGEEVDVNTLEGFYKYERIPENWKKPEQTVGVYNIISTVNEMRKVEERVENEQEEDKKKK